MLWQVIKETQDGRTVEHKYDDRSRLSHIVSALGGSITYGYDIKGTVNHISAGMSGKRKPWEANIAYDRFRRETSRIMPGCVENTMQYDNVRISVSVIMGEHCLISHTFGVIIFVFYRRLTQ